jgi:hypothetical protein
MWTDKTGNVHFSDHPSEVEASKRISSGESKESIVQRATRLTDQWLNARCDWQVSNRIQQRYQELRVEGEIKLQECRGGNARSCKEFGVSFAEAHMEKDRTMIDKYLPQNVGGLMTEKMRRDISRC